MNETVTTTRRDLATLGMDALNKDQAGAITVSRGAGGVSFSSVLEVMEFAKLMSISGAAVRKDFRNNPGMCLAVTFVAIEWRMSPFQVASKAYVVNDQLAYESQLVHAVIESRAPLQHRLECEYRGEKDTPERVCIITGHFTNGDSREYESPMIKNISPKNSPLWKTDPDQQLFYYASRAWARKWCPDVLMGIYTREEIQDNPSIGRDAEENVIEGAALRERLAGASRDEGHRPGHVESELDNIVANGGVVLDAEPTEEKPPTSDKPKSKRKPKSAKESEPEQAQEQEPQSDSIVEEAGELPMPTNPDEYAAYAGRWLLIETDAKVIKDRWKAEMKLRNDCGVTSEQREPVETLKNHRLEQLA